MQLRKIALLVSWLTLNSCTDALAAKATKLVQSHQASGKQIVYLSSAGVRIEHDLTGIVVVSQPPFTFVDVINPKKRNYVHKTSVKAVRQMRRPIMLLVEEPIADVAWQKPTPATFLGLKALSYAKTSSSKSWCHYTVLKEPAIPDIMIQLICAFSSSVPNLHGVPLRLEQSLSLQDEPQQDRFDGPRHAEIVFDTKSAQQVEVADSFFKFPKDFTCANGTNNAVPDTGAVQATKEMFNSPDFLYQSTKQKMLQPVRNK